MAASAEILIAAQGFFLGSIFSVHAAALIAHVVWGQVAWSLYATWWSVYHFLEFLVTAVYNPSLLKWNSFLLDQSKAYAVAVLCSWAEFWLGYAFFPMWKEGVAGWAGGALVVLGAGGMWLGQSIRTTGMVTAGTAFTHMIQQTRRNEHKLVQHGIYSFLRHPGYTGWFYASISTQLLLGNPVCFVLYAFAAWKFFAERIPEEEYHLFGMFRGAYLQYRKKTWILIPFIQDPFSGVATRTGAATDDAQT